MGRIRYFYDLIRTVSPLLPHAPSPYFLLFSFSPTPLLLRQFSRDGWGPLGTAGDRWGSLGTAEDRWGPPGTPGMNHL